MKNNYAQIIYTPAGLVKNNPWPEKKILHLGCGKKKIDGAIGMDILSLAGVDVVHNLDIYPWPIEDSSVDMVVCHSVVEHITDLVSFFNEIWRILKIEGRVVVAVPYFRSVDSFTDITHKHFFTSNSMDYFCDKQNGLSNYQYTDRLFSQVGFWYGWPSLSNRRLIRIFKKFILRHRNFYDQFLSLVLPVKVLVWELEVANKNKN
jgi:SAM-dependent methyltransferase